jgi:ATP synthase protein I
MSDLAQAYRKAAPYINSTYVLFASVALMGAVGWLCDGYFSTKPIFFICGLLAGLAAGFYQFFKVIKKLEA